MTKRRPASVFFTAVLLIVLYFALFPYPFGRELVAKPVWAVAVSPASNNETAGPSSAVPAGSSAFQLGDLIGYVAPDGRLLHLEPRLFQATLSQKGYINYTRVGTDWILRDPRGQRLLAFSGNGYPLLSPDGTRVMVVNSDLTGIREVDRNGNTAWSRDFPALMTSISLQSNYLLVGLLNGSLQLLGAHGLPVFRSPPGPSRVPVIYGCAVAPDGSFLASVAGVQPQVLTVLGRSGSTYSAALRAPLSTDYRREIRMGFSPDSRWLYYEARDAVGMVEPRGGGPSSVALPGTLAGCAFLGEGRAAVFAAQNKGRVALRVVLPFLAPLSSQSFGATAFSLGTIDGQILLGVDGRLMRVDLEEL